MPWILTEIFIRIDTARSDAEWQKDHKNPLSILFHCYRHGSVFMVCFIRFVLFSGALCATYTTLEFVCFCVFRSVYGCNMFACMLWFSFHWHILLGFGAYSISIILYSAIFNVFLMCIPHRLSKQMRLVSLFFSIAHNLCAFTLFLTGRISRASNEKLLSNHFRRIFLVDGLPFVLPLFCSSLMSFVHYVALL